MSGPAPIRRVSLETSDGLTLEGELAVPDASVAAVVLLHPHPLFGGDMRALVTGELFRLLPMAGVACVRCNFRGVGRSEGSHDDGVGETADAVAALDAVVAASGHERAVMVGWSFGADVSLRVADERVSGWAAVAPPLRALDAAPWRVDGDARPKLLVVPEHDQFNPPARARAEVEAWSATAVEVVAGADHFLVGRTDRVADLVTRFVLDL